MSETNLNLSYQVESDELGGSCYRLQTCSTLETARELMRRELDKGRPCNIWTVRRELLEGGAPDDRADPNFTPEEFERQATFGRAILVAMGEADSFGCDDFQDEIAGLAYASDFAGENKNGQFRLKAADGSFMRQIGDPD